MIPLIINLTLFSLLIWFGVDQFSALIELLLPDKLDWLRWLLWPLFALATLVIVLFSFTILANIIGAPFNGLLSEKVEEYLTGKKPESGGWDKMMKNLIPTAISELKKLIYVAGYTVLFLSVFMIPILNVIAPLLWMLFSAWMIALEYMDYPMSNHNISFNELRKRLRERIFLTMGFGFSTLFLITIPLINLLAMPSAVAGATVMWVEEWGRKEI